MRLSSWMRCLPETNIMSLTVNYFINIVQWVQFRRIHLLCVFFAWGNLFLMWVFAWEGIRKSCKSYLSETFINIFFVYIKQKIEELVDDISYVPWYHLYMYYLNNCKLFIAGYRRPNKFWIKKVTLVQCEER